MQGKTDEKEVFIEVAYDNGFKKLSKEETVKLCEEGLKYSAVKENYQRLLNAAKMQNLSVSDYLNALEQTRNEKRREELIKQCGGNQEIAEHIIELETKNQNQNQDNELNEFFPNLKQDMIPKSVIERAKQNNTKLLDEYLRFRAKEEADKLKQKQKEKDNAAKSIGSLAYFDTDDLSPERIEFLKGVWN